MKDLIPARYMVAFMTMMGLVVIYPQRGNLSVAIVAMVASSGHNNQSLANATAAFDDETCPYPSTLGNNTESDSDMLSKGEFHWSQTTQGFILGGFFYGYVITQPLGGRFSDMFGAKIMFAIGVIISSIMSLITPLAARWNVPAFIAVRVVMGLAQSINIPAVFSLMVKWIPPAERGILLSLALLGAHLGNIIVMPITGFLCEGDFMGGWPASFYLFGCAGFIWLGFWWFLVYDSPEEHPRISENEMAFLREKMDKGEKKVSSDPENVPWFKLLTSKAVLSLAYAKLALAWNYNGMLTKLPSYLESVLHFNIQDNSNINSMMYGAAGISLMLSGYLADVIIKRSRFSTGAWRKTFQAIASFGTSICLFFIPTARCNDTLVVILLITNMAFYGVLAGGEQSNGVEIAPQYSGLISGICNSFSSISGFLTPLIAGLFLEGNEGSAVSWSYFFYMSAAINVTGGLVFIAFSSSTVQPWALEGKDKLDQLESNKSDPIKMEKLGGIDNNGFIEKY